MKPFLLTIAFTLVGLFSSVAQAQTVTLEQTIPLTIDSSQSSVNFSIGGSDGISQLSGDATFNVDSANPPSGSAQISALNLVLDDALRVSFGGNILQGTTTPGDVTISMVTPGNPGTISGSSFAQLANSLALGGDLAVADPFGLAGGSQTIDLSTLAISPVDFTSIDVTQSGDDITVSSSFSFTQTITLGFRNVDIDVSGNFVASGEVPVSVIIGDVNLDGVIDCSDIGPFIMTLATGEFQAEADCDLSGEVDFDDILPFINVLICS